MKLIATLFALLISISFSRGVQTTVDDFTGELTCQQSELLNDVFLSASNTEGELLFALIKVASDVRSGLVFQRQSNDFSARVIIRFGDGSVETYIPDSAQSILLDRTNIVTFSGLRGIELLNDIVNSEGNLLVRFEGTEGRTDFTLYRALFERFDTGFLASCLDIDKVRVEVENQAIITSFTVQRSLDDVLAYIGIYCPEARVQEGLYNATVTCNEALTLRVREVSNQVTIYPDGTDHVTFERIRNYFLP
jgi:hypothetical protein